jgi:hypothetical protein
VTGLSSAVSITHADPTDQLVVDADANDNVNVSGVTGLIDVQVA